MLGTLTYKAPKKMASGQVIRVTTGEDGKKKVVLPALQAMCIKLRKVPTESDESAHTTLVQFKVDKRVARMLAAVEDQVIQSIPEEIASPIVEQYDSRLEEIMTSTISIGPSQTSGHMFKPRVFNLDNSRVQDLLQGSPVQLQLRVFGVRITPPLVTLVWEIIKVTPMIAAPSSFTTCILDSDDEENTDDEYVCPYLDELIDDLRAKITDQIATLESSVLEARGWLDSLESMSLQDLESLRSKILNLTPSS